MSTETIGTDELFDGSLDSKMDFLEDKQNSRDDGLYKVDMNKVKDKQKGWKSVIRFLPNLKKEGGLGQSAIPRERHFIQMEDDRELTGFYDSPRNFGEKCPLTELYFNMKKSKNAILVEKADKLNYAKKYYSYIMVIEDEQQPELVGKIMVYEYGKTIRDKILSEKNGDVSGESCNVFDLVNGKDFVILAKEVNTGERTYPSYEASNFRNISPIKIYSEKRGEFKTVPLDENGKIDPKYKEKIINVLRDRDHELEEFEPKRLTEDDQEKITEISNILLGKASSSYKKKNNEASSSDFLQDDVSKEESKGSSELPFESQTEDEDEDDFFDDL